MNNNKVYIHITPIGKVYVGITSTTIERRWRNNGNGYKNQYFYRAIKKYGWDNIEHKILYTNLSKEEAEQKEIELIKKYKSNDKRFGYNIDDGGYLFSKEHLEHLSKSHKGYKHTEEAKKKMSAFRIGNKYACGSKSRKGIPTSEETKEKIKMAHIKRSRQIYCIELDTTFISIREASRILKIDRTNIKRCCLGTQHTTHNYHFKFKD